MVHLIRSRRSSHTGAMVRFRRKTEVMPCQMSSIIVVGKSVLTAVGSSRLCAVKNTCGEPMSVLRNVRIIARIDAGRNKLKVSAIAILNPFSGGKSSSVDTTSAMRENTTTKDQESTRWTRRMDQTSSATQWADKTGWQKA